MKLLFALSALASVSASPPAEQCSAPVAVPTTVTTPHATYYSDDEPPARFAHAPTGEYRLTFGQDGIDKLCGRPPCGMRFLGCTRGDQIALPSPFDPEFAHIARHEAAHLNHWPETHGD